MARCSQWLITAVVAVSCTVAVPRGQADEEAAGPDATATPLTVDESAGDTIAPNAAAGEDSEPSAPEPAAEPVDPAPAGPPAPQVEPPGSHRVRIKLDASGEMFAPAGRDVPPVRRPIAVDARFDFVEVIGAGPEMRTATRRYQDAAAEVRVDDAVRTTRLPPDARELRVVVAGATPQPCLDSGFLTREELDLLETPFDPLLIDRLLPGKAVAVGDSWAVAADDVAGLLAIDTVESGGLDVKLIEVGEGRAELKVSGIVDGAADGVPTHVVVEGTCVADAAGGEGVDLRGLISHVAVTLQERREASHVAPGFDVEARLTVARTAVEAPGGVPPVDAGSGQAASARRRQGAGRPGFVWQRDSAGRYDVVHDARWRAIEDGPDGLVMRFVDRGALVAQCSITALPRGSSQSPPTIAEVERDLERSLAGQFGRFEHSSEATRSDGVRIVRVVATGRADGLPFRWIHVLLTNAAGDRLAVSCTLEEASARRFGTSDRELVDGIRFPETGESAAETAETVGGATVREARLPQDFRTP